MITVFLDFDGVLFDTLKEAYVLCRHVCFGTDIFEPIEPEIYKKFFRYKFLVFNSWQYFYLMKVIKEYNNLSDEEFINKYNYYINHRIKNEEDLFEKTYMEKRKWLIENHPEYVDKLEEKFPFLDMINTLDRNKYDILIVSRKNSFAIKRKGIDFKIVGKEELLNVVNKSEFLEKYILENNVERAFFVDDNSHNLTPCKNIKNLTCILAGWGNIGISEKGMTQEEAFNLILNLDK